MAQRLLLLCYTITMMFREFLDQRFLGNTLENYMWFAGILLFGYIFKTLLSRLLSELMFRSVKQYSEDVTKAEFRHLLIRPLEVLMLLFFLYLAFDRLEYPPEWSAAAAKGKLTIKTFVQRVYQFFVIVAATWVVLRLADFTGLIFAKRAEKTVSKLDDQLVPFFKDFGKVLVVIIGIIVIMGNIFGVNVWGLVGGLGIGGLALAFAAKESLENFLASFMIFMDQPFTVGDLVQSGEIIGTIEKIGFRSTRIRTLEKSFVTVPNKLMIDKPLDNLTLRTFRRARFDIALTYKTRSEQMRAITKDIQEFVDNHPRTNQDGRVRFLSLGPHSKDVMVQYFVDTMDWNEFIDIKEEINYKIVEIVEQHGAEFALPTQTVYLRKDEV